MITADRATRPGTHAAAERVAWLFYVVSALASALGQVGAGVMAPFWAGDIGWVWRLVIVAPFALCLDLAGVVTSAMADHRQRLGETALGWRILSAVSVAAALSINILGHHDQPLLAAAFGFFGAFAYTVWLLHSAARRRDSLRAAGKLADTAPAYGFKRWLCDYQVTRLARELALEKSLSLYESLNAAREQLRRKRQVTALASHIETLIRSRYQDKIRADIAATTVPVDTLAALLAEHIDITSWARHIAADLTPPAGHTSQPANSPQAITPPMATVETSRPESRPANGTPQWTDIPDDVVKRIPASPAVYSRWQELWAQMRNEPALTNRTLAQTCGISVRTLQHIRRAGSYGLLDKPAPPEATPETAEVNGYHRAPHAAGQIPWLPAPRAGLEGGDPLQGRAHLEGRLSDAAVRGNQR